MSITFSSCFYIIKSKFNPSTYIEWMGNFLSIVNNFNLVIYTDLSSSKYISQEARENSKIKIILKPLEHFYNYKYKDFWIKNHDKNLLLNDKSCWQLNMLWSEKIWFVKETIERKYFETDWYGWCDIGYFRNRPEDLHTSFLSAWPSKHKIMLLNREKIVYACINNDVNYIQHLDRIINTKNSNGLPLKPIPPHYNSVAGGFFILYKDKISWWTKIFDTKLQLYFKHNYLVKDDQIILIDCIMTNQDHFTLFRENDQRFDNWFMFQRILLPLEKVEPKYSKVIAK
jgi:hypothetical protein